MEHKIGEIFEYNSEWYQCLKSSRHRCNNCDFDKSGKCYKIACVSDERKDGKKVHFKKLEKVKEPYEYFVQHKGIVMLQPYKLFATPIINGVICNIHYDTNTIDLEIKQTKEDMEEKKIKLSQENIDWLKKQIRWAVLPGYITHEEDYDRVTEEIMNLFIPSNTEHSSSEKIGKNLKPFDIEAAKAGEPVYTRDGRSARIICFNRVSDKFPIIALVMNTENREDVYYYDNNGKDCHNKEKDYDLVMKPKIKTGWINVHKENGLYKTEEDAINNRPNDDFVAVKVEFEI